LFLAVCRIGIFLAVKIYHNRGSQKIKDPILLYIITIFKNLKNQITSHKTTNFILSSFINWQLTKKSNKTAGSLRFLK
jgi:hypothetical protein